MTASHSDPTRAVYVISVAAELAGVHPQTLRNYERYGPARPEPDRGRLAPVLRARPRAAPPHPGADQRGPEPRGGPPGAEPRGASSTRLRAELRRLAEEHAAGARRDAPQLSARHRPAEPVADALPERPAPLSEPRAAPRERASKDRDMRSAMPIDPERWTNRTREAFSAATTQATAAGQAEVTPTHVLAAVLAQPEGIAHPDPAQPGRRPHRAGAPLRRDAWPSCLAPSAAPSPA